ncbi:Rof/RNase P-like protein [Gaertneriomyces semiglobifer]|nr:Rof/RNase P-like protein [Gaertneriomyces semiglobifer]
MSNKLRKKSGLYDIPTDVKYEAFLPLHQLWKGYMNMLLADSAHGTTAMMRLLKADYHGAVFSVVRSKCPTYVGITGIVIKETENMFYIVTEQDEAKVVPKRNNVFMFETREGERFTLFGNQFCTRSGERVAKKFKDKPTVDM